MRTLPKTITSANSVLLGRVPGLIDTWTRIEGFASDEAFGIGKGAMVETSMGVDGGQAGGWTPYETQWDLSLMANSPSRSFFDVLMAAQDREQEAYQIELQLTIPSIKKHYEATGFMTEADSGTSGKKVLDKATYTCKTVMTKREDV